MKLRKVRVKNIQDVDIYVCDVFGTVHTIFPKQEKTLLMLAESEGQRRKKNGIK